MLAKAHRVRTGEQFSSITKGGARYTTPSLVMYVLSSESISQVKFGLIINKSVGGSVTRHRIARQLRHYFAPHLPSFPSGTQVVIRVLKEIKDYRPDLSLALEREQRGRARL